ncbi:venom carboxylesterase-6-like isoform X2 [Periplaneta americana]
MREATRYSPVCIQRSIFAKQVEVAGSEDCLYLNVFSPKVATNAGMDVMVWFHGGGFVSGAGSFYGPEHLLDEDIVLVTVNYRLGPIGFLSTGDAVAPGNFGLKDQVAALRWVHENIRVFGGNPDSVTLFGESAGGSSVHYHMLSPLSKGLFHRGISQSGTALCTWAIAANGTSTEQAKKLATLLNCPTRHTADLVDCLRTKDAKDIISTDKKFMEWDVDPLIPFKPVVEPTDMLDAFLPAEPLQLLQEGPQSIPWLTGINSGDGALKAAAIYEKEELVIELNSQFERLAPITLLYRDLSSPDMAVEISQRIRSFYFDDLPIGNDTLLKVVDMYTDSFFLWAADEAVRIQLSRNLLAGGGAPIYYYYFAYRGPHSFSELFGDPTRDFGVCHADELIYLFPAARVFGNFTATPEEEKMTDYLIHTWTNFARTGNPTPLNSKSELVATKWLPVSSTNDLEYLHIGSPSDIHMDNGLLQDRVQFWTSLPLRPTRAARSLLHDEL